MGRLADIVGTWFAFVNVHPKGEIEMTMNSIFRRGIALVALGLLVVGGSAWAESGTVKGPFSCHGEGKATQMNAELMHWVGMFWCATYANSGKGPFHQGAWTCTGETEIRNGSMTTGGGFCKIYHPGGDTVEIRWDRVNNNQTKGACISGSGKYAGIQCSYIGNWNPGIVGPDSVFVGYIDAEYTVK